MPVTFAKRTKKTPKKMRHTGFEIECIAKQEWSLSDEESDQYDRYDDLYEKKCLGAAKKFVLNIHDDGSVEGSGYPAEVVTQPLLDNRATAMKALCNKIKERGGYVNKSCGGHIHVDAKDIKLKLRSDDNILLAVKFLSLCEPALYAVTGKGRLENSFCNPLTSFKESGWNDKVFWNTSDLFGDRYHSINFCALEDHGTLEFRLFAGTLEPEKWIARAAFSEAVVNKLSDVIKNPKLLDKLHKKSVLSNINLEDLIDCDFDKHKLYKDMISTKGPELVDNIAKLVGLHHKYRKALVKQHKDIWGKYAKDSE